MPQTSETGKIFYADINSPELGEATRMVQDYYAALGAKAVVFMDKDNTVINMEEGIPTDARLPGIISSAQEKGIIVSYNSDSSWVDLEGQLGMKGVSIAERGGLIRFPNGAEIHLVRSAEWCRKLLSHFTERIRNDPILHGTTALLELDPWPIIFADTHIPGSQNQVIMINSGRKVTAGIVTGLLDQSRAGKIIRHTEESLSFHRKMTEILLQERNNLVLEESFPDPEGMIDDINTESELTIIKSKAATKQRAMRFLAEALLPLGIKIYYIGDNAETDNMTDIPGIITMAVGNGGLKDVDGVVAAIQPMASGVVELFEQYIIPEISNSQ